METLTDAMNRLRTDGYSIDFSATEDGQIQCGACGVSEEPENLSVIVTERFEGDSNPDDEAILLGVACRCGGRGQYAAAFGPDTPHEDAAVLRQLGQRRDATDG